jgi:hypothetical protein
MGGSVELHSCLQRSDARAVIATALLPLTSKLEAHLALSPSLDYLVLLKCRDFPGEGLALRYWQVRTPNEHAETCA